MTRQEWIRDWAFGSILDVGCGEGSCFVGYSPPFEVTGTDIDVWKPVYSNGFVEANAHTLPMKDDSFDCVVLAEVLQYVQDPKKVLEEALRVTKKAVIFTIANENHWDAKNMPKAKPEDIAKSLNIPSVEMLANEMTRRKSTFVAGMDEAKVPHLFSLRYFTTDTLITLLESLNCKYALCNDLCYEGWAFFCGWVKKEKK